MGLHWTSWIRGGAAVGVALIALLVAPAVQAATPTVDIASAGPLTGIFIGNDLGCQIAYSGDSTDEFFPPASATPGDPSSTPGDCGTLLSTGGSLYTPDFANHNGTASDALGTTTPFTPVSQSAVTGAGTALSPYQVSTTVAAGSTDLSITETDSYVVGAQDYRTDIVVTNSGSATASALLYHAGDCYLQNSDTGYGFIDPSTNAPACTLSPNGSAPGPVQQFIPGAPGTHYVETNFNSLWTDIGQQTDLPDTCDCTADEDNAAGINWDLTIPPGSVTQSLMSNFLVTGSPQVTVAGVAVTGSTAAAVSDSVTPGGLATTAHYEYGLDPSYLTGGMVESAGVVYTNSTPTTAVGSDFSAHPVPATLIGLVPNAVYHVRLVATNSAGTVEGPDQVFKTAEDPSPPPPTIATTFNIAPVSGRVFIQLPDDAHTASAARGPAKGAGFEPLTEARQLPFGTKVDSRAGSLQLLTATGHIGKPQAGTFGGAVFGLSQKKRGRQKGLTTVSLLDGAVAGAPSYAGCSAHAAVDGLTATAAHAPPKVLQTLHARDHNGAFRTTGRYAAGTVRGTVWSMSDRCDGTLTAVSRGIVDVTVFATRQVVAVHAHHSLLARATASHRR